MAMLRKSTPIATARAAKAKQNLMEKKHQQTTTAMKKTATPITKKTATTTTHPLSKRKKLM